MSSAREVTTRLCFFPFCAVLVLAALAPLTVDAQARASLEVAPLRLSFIGSARAERLASQSVRIRNAGTGQISWRARATAPWVTVSAERGTGDATILVGVDNRMLEPGSYSARVIVEAPGASQSPQTIDVAVSIASPRSAAATTVLRVVPDRLAFSSPGGQSDKLTSVLHVDGERGGQGKWTAKSDQPWLDVSPREGNTPADISVTASPSSLKNGDYNGQVLVTAAGRSTPVRIPVSLSVQSSGGRFTFTSTNLPTAVMNVPYSQPLPVRGGRPPYNLQLNGQLPSELGLVNGTIVGMPRVPGMYAFTIVANDSSTPPATITATFTLPVVIVTQGTLLSVQPAEVQLSGTAQSSPDPVNVRVTCSGPALSWTLSADADWLRIAPPSGTAPSTFEVRADTSGLKPGTYKAAITVIMPGVPNSPARVPVTLTVK